MEWFVTLEDGRTLKVEPSGMRLLETSSGVTNPSVDLGFLNLNYTKE